MNAMVTTRSKGLENGYARVNDLDIYYEIHGAGRPLVLLHGALMMIGSFGRLLPPLAGSRRVIAVELQGHGHTADADRPFSYEQMADDVAELLRHLHVGSADLLGYSLGGGVAIQMGVRHPGLVRKMVIVSAYVDIDGVYPEVLKGEEETTPEGLEGFGWREAYEKVAPDPANWPVLISKVKQLDLGFQGWPSEDIRSIQAPTMLIIGDSDIVPPEQAARMFRLLGGGVPGDLVGVPPSRLAVLPGTTHGTVIERTDILVPLIAEFLDGPAESK